MALGSLVQSYDTSAQATVAASRIRKKGYKATVKAYKTLFGGVRFGVYSPSWNKLKGYF
jgi:hypothetical protein